METWGSVNKMCLTLLFNQDLPLIYKIIILYI